MSYLLVTGIYPPDIGGPATFIPGLRRYMTLKSKTTNLLTLSDDVSASKIAHPNVTFVSRKSKFPFRQIDILCKLVTKYWSVKIVFANGLFEEVAVFSALMRKNFICKIVGDPIWERYRNQTGRKISIEDFNSQKMPLKYKLQRLALTKALNRAASICTPSQQLADMIREWGISVPVLVIPNGVPKSAETGIHEKQFDVVTVSRLVAWKNIQSIIEACAISNLDLAIVGDGPEMSFLKGKAVSSGAKVKFLGNLEGDDLTDALNQSKIFCLYSDYEGLSFALISALMNGMYVVASDIPGNRNVIRDGVNGVLVALNSPSSLAKALLNGIIDNSDTETIRINAKHDAEERYLDNKCYEKTLNLMDSFCE